MGPLQGAAEDDPRRWASSSAALKVDDKRARPPPGDHHLDDPGGARQPQDHRRLAPAPDRPGVGHHRPGGLPAGQAVRPDAEDDAPDLARARCPTCSSWRAAAEPGPQSARRAANLPAPMSVRVRLTRVGSKKNPIWRVVVADQRSPRDGRFIEIDRALQPADRAVDDRASTASGSTTGSSAAPSRPTPSEADARRRTPTPRRAADAPSRRPPEPARPGAAEAARPPEADAEAEADAAEA